MLKELEIENQKLKEQINYKSFPTVPEERPMSVKKPT